MTDKELRSLFDRQQADYLEAKEREERHHRELVEQAERHHRELVEQAERHHRELMKYRTGNPDRQEVVQEIVGIQHELLLRERRKHPLVDPAEIKGYSNARAVAFVKKDCGRDDPLYKRCEYCRRGVERIAQDEQKSESEVWRGMIKAVERAKK